MSAQHTPGRLAVAVEIFDNDGMPETALQALGGAATVAVALEFGPNNPGMREANARRLAACWNACEGIPVEVLEAQQSGGLPWNVADQIEQRVQFDAYKEGSEQAFSDVVEQKRKAEESAARMEQTIQSQQGVIVKMRDQRDTLLAVLQNFEITGPDDDGLVWLILNGNGTSGKGMFNLGKPANIAAQVALALEQDRTAAIAKATSQEGKAA